MSDRPAVARAHEEDELAAVSGSRAGVVEWANDAFSRLTGIPLADTVNKPVLHFLERAGLEIEVVDFVAQHFFEGRPCRLEFPFERPDGRRIEVLLEVEALRDALGEIDRFHATARERCEPPPDALAASPRPGTGSVPTTANATVPLHPPTHSPARIAAEAPLAAFDRATADSEPSGVALAPVIERALAAAPARLGLRAGSEAWLLDLALSPEPLCVRASEETLAGLVAALVRAARGSLAVADHAWGTITLTTGRTTPHRRFISQVHAIPASAPALAGTRQIHLEVHDTGAPIDVRVLARLRRLAESGSEGERSEDPSAGTRGPCRARPRGPDDARDDALSEAIRTARRLGASIHLDSTPGCGNQVLVLFPD